MSEDFMLTQACTQDLEPEGSKPERPFRDLRTQREFGRYELLMEVSAGGMATLYLARLRGPQGFEKLLAVKRIHDHLATESEFVAMFLDEARIAARIQHPNVASVFDMGQEAGSYYIAMEYVHGNSLVEILREAARRRSPLPWELVVRMVADAARGLHAAHELTTTDGSPLKVVHRDVSPQNLLLSYEGYVKVVDFGIAAAAEKSGHTRTGLVKGKAAYMSPEQATGQPLDRRSDIFSLGVVLWEALCMRRLFRKDTEAGTLMAVRETLVPRPTELRPSLPFELERILRKALAQRPEERFDTAEEMAERLEALLMAQKKPVTTTDLSRLMKGFFRERIQAKDIQVRRALRGNQGEVPKSLGTEWNTGTSIELDDVGVGAGARWRRGLRASAVVGMVIAAVGLIALGVHLIMGMGRPLSSSRDRSSAPKTQEIASREARESPPPPDKGGTVPDVPPGMPQGSGPGTASGVTPQGKERREHMISVRLTVVPHDARVEVRHRQRVYRTNPFTLLLPRSDEPESLEISASGFLTQSLVVVPVASIVQTITLKPREERAMRPPRPPDAMLLEDLPR